MWEFICEYLYVNVCTCVFTVEVRCGWAVKALDSQPKGCEFKPWPVHCIVPLDKALYFHCLSPPSCEWGYLVQAGGIERSSGLVATLKAAVSVWYKTRSQSAVASFINFTSCWGVESALRKGSPSGLVRYHQHWWTRSLSLSLCMYVCMYVYMYACMHACMYVCMYVCMYEWGAMWLSC